MHSAFITLDNDLYTCGDSQHGRLCRTVTSETDSKTPNLVEDFKNTLITKVPIYLNINIYTLIYTYMLVWLMINMLWARPFKGLYLAFCINTKIFLGNIPIKAKSLSSWKAITNTKSLYNIEISIKSWLNLISFEHSK